MPKNQKANSAKARAVVSPTFNKWETPQAIVPLRFNSTSGISHSSIVSSDFNSTSTPQILADTSKTGQFSR